MPYFVRRVRAEEWEAVRATRLESLRDPAAHLAFLESYETAAAQPEEFWKLRAANAADGGVVCQQVVVGPGGAWVGTVTGLLEEEGARLRRQSDPAPAGPRGRRVGAP